MDDRLIGAPFFHQSQISFQGIFRSSFSEMPGKTVNDVDLSGRFMQLVNDIGEQAAAGGENAIIHVGDELSFGFRQLFGNFIGKR